MALLLNQARQPHKSLVYDGIHSGGTGATLSVYDFCARWYDPITGRWLSNDPIGISGGLNQYVFCANNPVNRGDPFGLRTYKVTVYENRGLQIGHPSIDIYTYVHTYIEVGGR